MNTDQTGQTYNHIHERADGARKYVLHPENDELFTRTGKQVIEGCRLGISIEVWFFERDSMFDDVRRWIEEGDHKKRIAACYAVPRGVGIGLFFVPKSQKFDFDLADALAVLNATLVRGFNIGPVEVLQIPEDELDRFITPKAAIELYYHAKESHQTMET